MFITYLLAIGVGLLTEIIARTARLWIYRKPINPIINILMTFGLVMGGLSLLIPSLGHFPVFLIAITFGYGYEQLNFAVLDWWFFPDDRFLIFKGKQACAISVGLLWGGVPSMINFLHTLLLKL